MSTISIHNVTFSYDGQKPIFKQLNLSIDSSWKLGLLGRNGRGKTTFLKILTKQLEYQGKIESDLTFRYFPLFDSSEKALVKDLLAREFVYEAWQLEIKFDQLGLSTALLDRPFASLSGGEQTKVELAADFLDEQNFVLLDEPTNHLDLASRQVVATFLQKQKQGMIVISHDREFIDQVVDHVLVIEKQKIRLEKGNYATWQQVKEHEDHYQTAKNQQIMREITQLSKDAAAKKQWASQNAADSASEYTIRERYDRAYLGRLTKKADKRAKTAQKRVEKKIEEKVGLLANIERVDQLTMNPAYSHERFVLQLKDLQLAYHDHDWLFAPLNLDLHRREIIALTGNNGLGKSSIFKAIIGEFAGTKTGKIELASGLTIAYLPQILPIEDVTLPEFAAKSHLDLEEFLNCLHKLGIERETFGQKLPQLSAGQQKKVFLAKSLLTPAHLYLWDEPLNYLDTYNQTQLIELLKKYKPTMLVIEHDKRFISDLGCKVDPIQPQ